MRIVDGVNYTNWTRTHFQKLKDAGVSIVHVTAVYWENTTQTIEIFNKWDSYFKENSDLIIQIKTRRDIDDLANTGKVGVVLGWQNSAPINSSLKLLDFFFEKGLRIMQLTYNNQSYIASGCFERQDAKISRFGKEVIKQMNSLGIAIDLSHINNQSGVAAVELSERPVCVSHSIPVFSKNSNRNISTELMKAVAENGGILGLSLYPLHVKNGSDCTLPQYCQLIEQTIEIMGIGHVGIGSDLCTDHPNSVLQWMRCGDWMKITDKTDGYFKEAVWPKPMSWFKEISDISHLIAGMREYGFSEKNIEKIIGLNWIDYMRSVFPK